MDPIILGTALAVAAGVSGVVYGQIVARRARRIRQQADEIVKAATAVVISSLGAHLAGELGGQVVGFEQVSSREFLEALDAAGLPTPGCGCEVCDERRLRRPQAERGER